MARIKIQATVLEVKQSVIKHGCYYVTAETKEFGIIKYVSKRRPKIGELVVLQDQKLRAMTDKIRWQEKRESK